MESEHNPKVGPAHKRNVTYCCGCDLLIEHKQLVANETARCPECNSKLYQDRPNQSQQLALAIAGLLLFFVSHVFPFIRIRLFGVMIHSTLLTGSLTVIDEGFPFLGILILFCTSIAPLFLFISVLTTHLGLRYQWLSLFRMSLKLHKITKNWSMLDVFLTSIAISFFKLQDYAELYPQWGMLTMIAMQLMIFLLVTKFDIAAFWQSWEEKYPSSNLSTEVTESTAYCYQCHLNQPDAHHCYRCLHPLAADDKYKLQECWAYLLTAAIATFPANFIPISILLSHGTLVKDTIYSGVTTLINDGLYGIAFIIFTASIIVPIAKIIGLIYLLICIHRKTQFKLEQKMRIYFLLKWIGRWSMMDMFVVAIMIGLLERGQLLNFTPSYGAVAFGIVVVLTMLAAETLDTKLLWNRKKRNHYVST